MRRVPPALLALPALGIAQLLPHDGVGLALRLAAATAAVLLPGALVTRALGLVGAWATLAWTLAALFAAFAVTFAVGGSLTLALALLAAVGAIALPFALRRVSGSEPLSRSWWTLGVLLVGAAFGIALWHVAGATVQGDGLFHLARVRKLEAFGSLSLHAVDEFRNGGLHPGYAFPLWHGFLAAVARLAGVDPAAVVLHEPTVLTPLALLVAFEAGRELFRSDAGGAATMLAQVALIALAPGDGGAYRVLALPATAARQLIAVAVLAAVFAAVERPSAATYATAAAGALALALVHPTYALFVLVPVGGFVVVRMLFARDEAGRLIGALAALAVPTGAVALWLLPIVRETASHDPSEKIRLGATHGIARYAGQLDVFSPHSYRLAPEVLARGGAVAIAGLVLVPLAGLAARRRFAAFVLGGSLAVLALVLVPFLFTRLADAVSLSQARRAAGFMPLAFAFAGGAALLARVPVAVIPVSLAAGIALQLAWPGEFGYRFHGNAPAFAAWVATWGGLAALVAGVLLRWRTVEEARGPLVVLGAALFVVPVAWHGLSHFEPPPRGLALPAGLVDALRTRVPKGDVVFSDLETSYRIAAFAPVYIAAAPPSHVADTKANRPEARAREVNRFLKTGRLAIPRRYNAGWIVLDRRRFKLRLRLPVVFRDSRYTLYRL